MENNDKPQLNIEIKPEVAGGHYSNLAVISHSHTEFVIDFAQMLPGLQKANVCSRIVMAPEHAKRLMNALVDNVGKYEQQFGEINLGGAPKGTFNVADFIGNGNGSKS